ncbi:galactocerebrosidase-like isoform X2 [Ruditapes philippinarum]|uniref:galactocerebrosidase-like isoform X2 n=1 Tax=Ruditapes philippinarum TaxID=129788 RepID=UPI00295BAE28|nr:galactocerebrosidase-like isoform X2 [Ruditapes philippinarum]
MFYGIGGLSGGGATSKLLVNYPKEQRDQILDYLFKPGFGASLHILKVEIGGDAQSTDGTEASHMHYPWEENYERGYEWWLMTEAKKRNPDIQLYCLPWAFPAWVGAGKRNPYNKPELTASYVVKFIQGARKYYNLTMNYVGIWNERNYNADYIKVLRKTLDSAGFNMTRIVAADGLWEPISLNIVADSALAKAVDIIGVHYPGTKNSEIAMKTGKPLWSSEDYSTFNDNVGAGCWARILNQNYVNGYMTSTISWNLITSYYEALPYTRNGLMTADSPWSGFYRVDAPIWMTAHTSQFVFPGWNYLAHDYGVTKLKNGGSMVSFVSYDSTQLTIVIETMSRNHSICVRPFLPEYNVSAQTVKLQMAGYFGTLFKLNVRYSKLGFDGEDSVLFKDLGSIPVINGSVTLNLDVDEVYTLTTLVAGSKGNYTNVPAQKPFPLPYTDNFESYSKHNEPFNLAQQIGAYEVLDSASSHGNIIRQMVTEHPCAWCQAEDANSTLNLIGDSSWSDIYVEADTRVGTVNATTGVFIAARINKGGCDSVASEGIFYFLLPAEGTLLVTGDLARTKTLYQGAHSLSVDPWYKQGLLIKDGFAVGTLNGQQVFNISAPGSPAPQNGFVGLGTASYGLADFDNLKIMDSSDGLRTVLSDTEQFNIQANEATNQEIIDVKNIQYNVKEIEYLETSNKHNDEDTLYFKPFNIDEQ